MTKNTKLFPLESWHRPCKTWHLKNRRRNNQIKITYEFNTDRLLICKPKASLQWMKLESVAVTEESQSTLNSNQDLHQPLCESGSSPKRWSHLPYRPLICWLGLIGRSHTHSFISEHLTVFQCQMILNAMIKLTIITEKAPFEMLEFWICPLINIA